MAHANTFRLSSLIDAVHAAVTAQKDDETVTTVATAALASATLADCAAAFRLTTDMARTARFSRDETISRACVLLEAKGIDMLDVEATRTALWPHYWTGAGKTGKPTKCEPGTKIETKETLQEYDNLYGQCRTMAAAIVRRMTPLDAFEITAALRKQVKAKLAIEYALAAEYAAGAIAQCEKEERELNKASVKAAKAKAKAKAKAAAAA